MIVFFLISSFVKNNYISLNPSRKIILIRNYSSDDSKRDIKRAKDDHDTDDDKNLKKEMKEQLQEKGNIAKGLIKKYGASAAIVYTAISIVDFFFFYGLISAGVDLNGIAEAIGFSLVGKSEKGVTLAVAYACHKLFLPIRLGIAVYITPKVHPYYNKFVKFVKERRDD